jgi:hypothetical protein
MGIKTPTYFKSLFITGYTPTETDYNDLWDSVLWWLSNVNSILKKVVWEIDFAVTPLTTVLTGGLPLIPEKSSIVKFYYKFKNLTYSNGNGLIDIKLSLDGTSLLNSPTKVSDLDNLVDYEDGLLIEETVLDDNEISITANGTDITSGTLQLVVEYLNF